jgi:hypothetical protein
MLRAGRKGSWTAKLLVVSMALLIGYPLIDVVEDALPHRIHRSGDVWVCDLKSLSNFDMDQVHGQTQDIPQAFRDLDGKRVLMSGQMWAPYDADGPVRKFELVYSIASCCFRGPPKVQHIVKASLPDGRSVPYSPGRVQVTGTLHVGVQKLGDAIDSIYRVDVDSVDPQ